MIEESHLKLAIQDQERFHPSWQFSPGRVRPMFCNDLNSCQKMVKNANCQ
jgi:hypothetical protein